MGIENKTGCWFRAEVLEVTEDRIKLRNRDTGEEVWTDKKKLKVIPKRIMAYINLPSLSSRHAGQNYKGFCIER